MESIAQVLQDLKRRVNTARAVVIVQAILLIGSAVFTLILHKWWPGIILLAAVMAAYFFLLQPMTKRYNHAVAAANLRFGLCSELEDFSYKYKDTLTTDEFEAWKMLPLIKEKGGLLTREGFCASSKNIRYSGSEMTVSNNAPTEGKRPARIFLSGTFLAAEGDDPVAKGDWLILNDKLLPPEILDPFLSENGYESSGYALEGYDIYSREADAELAQNIAERIEDIVSHHNTIAALRLCEKGAAAFLHHRFYTGSGKANAKVTEQQLRFNTLPERDSLWTLFRAWIKKQQ